MSELTLEEAIEHLDDELNNPEHKWECPQCKKENEQVLEWLKKLQAIDNANPSEALECLKRVWNDINNQNDFRQDFKDLTIVENYIIKAQEQEKENAEYKRVLELIKERRVDVFHLMSSKTVEEYNKIWDSSKYCLTEEEFELLKRWAKNENS